MSYTVEFKPSGLTVVCMHGTPLLEAIRQAGIALQSACGSTGRCGRCRIKIFSGPTPPPSTEEIMQLADPDLANGYRLACQFRVVGDTIVEIPSTSLIHKLEMTLKDVEFAVPLEPSVHDFLVEVEAFDRHNSQALWNDMVRELSHTHHQAIESIDTMALGNLPQVIGDNKGRVRISVRAHEVIAVRQPDKTPYGLAIDLGTTTMAGYLVDLETGKLLSALAVINPQRPYGEDVMSRIAYVLEKGDRELRKTVTEGLNALITSLCKETERIVDMILVGNTAMHHIFLGLPVKNLGRTPHRPSIREACDCKARDLGLLSAPGASIHVLPPVGGFVGADHAAMILAAAMHETERTVLGLDIGTNTEIALVHRGKITSISCASGPAFEGGHITHGTWATTGAIHKVKLLPPAVSFQTIGDTPPHGLCGSGILDAIAELSRLGIIDRKGRLAMGHDTGFPEQSGDFTLVPPEKTSTGRAITISQKDVSEVQLAKAAIRAGIDILLDETGITWKAVEEVILTGGLGTVLDPSAAIHIGMFPPFTLDHIRLMKNGAGAGALRCLISTSERAKAGAIARKISHLELMTHPAFKKRFGRAMYFP